MINRCVPRNSLKLSGFYYINLKRKLERFCLIVAGVQLKFYCALIPTHANTYNGKNEVRNDDGVDFILPWGDKKIFFSLVWGYGEKLRAAMICVSDL